jgi:hypothetical protein
VGVSSEDYRAAIERITELEAELQKWLDHYAGPDINVIPVPRYQIESLLKR